MIEYVQGDLIKSDEKFIAHGCNTWGVMGAGIALTIADTYPHVAAAYRTACAAHRFRLGEAQFVEVPHWHGSEDYRFVVNMATQDEPGPHARYGAVMQAFNKTMYSMSMWKQNRLAIPKIGCGIGGLEWTAVEWIIKELQDIIPDAPELVVYYL